MLPVLKQAGVVDSGGQGLVQVLKGAYAALIGKEIDYTIEGAPTGAAPAKISAETEAEIKFGYCTEFIIVLNAPMSDNEEHAYKAFLESIGDSIVVVADDEIVKTHVHTNDPGLALQKALTFGSLSKIKIDNMREEHQEKLIKDSQKLAAQQKAEEEAYEAAQAHADAISKASSGEGYATGGVNTYTGLAAVHGTKSRPEVFLNNSQAGALFKFIDGLTRMPTLNKRNTPQNVVASTSKTEDNSTNYTNCKFEVVSNEDSIDSLLQDVKNRSPLRKF